MILIISILSFFFIMTTNIKLLRSESQFCIFNNEDFNLFDINQFSYDVISSFLENRNISETANIYNLEEDDIRSLLDRIGYKSSPAISHENVSTKAIDRITLHVSNDCNLRCKYCYASGGAYGKSRELMTIETAERFVDYCCENFEKVRNIVFFGGEPFLNFPVIKLVCEKFHKKLQNGEIQYLPRFGAITNGTIQSPKVLSLIENYFSFLTVSIDGPKDINDLNRITDSGMGSFDRIYNFIRQISSFPNLNISIEATYTLQHIQHGYTRDMIREYFIKEFNIKADVVDEMSLDNSNSVISELENPLESPWFDSILKTIVCKEHETKCQILRSIFAISTSGDIYPCHMNVGDGMKPVTSIWSPKDNLFHIIKSSKLYSLKNNKVCHTCWAKNICGGCARLSFYDPEKKEYSHTPIESKCSDFKRIVESVLLKICEVRKNSELWKDLLTRVNTSNN